MDLIVAHFHPIWICWIPTAFHYLIPQHIPQGVELGQKDRLSVAVEYLCAGRELQGVIIIFRTSAHGAIDVDVALIVKGGVNDFIVIVAVGAVASRPVMRPLPLALGGGGEGDEKGGEGGHEKG